MNKKAEDQTARKEQKTLKMTKWLPVAVIVTVVILGAGAIAYFSSHDSSKQKPKGPAHGFTLTPPTDWRQVKPTPEGTSVAFDAPTADSGVDGSLRAFITVQSTPLNSSAQKMPFDQIAQAYVLQLAQAYTDYEQLAMTDNAIGETRAVMILFSFTAPDKTKVKAASLFTVKHGISYAVNGEALASVWEQHSKEIEASLLSFRP